jgi:hypothetical protein
MTPIADTVLRAATLALTARKTPSVDEEVLRGVQEDARAAAVAVLVALGGSKQKAGLAPYSSSIAQQLLHLADELEEAGYADGAGD